MPHLVRCQGAPQRKGRRVSGATGEPVGRLLWGPPAYQPRTPWRPGPALVATFAILAVSIAGAKVLPPLLGLDAIAPERPGEGEAAHTLMAGLRVLATFQLVAIALTLLVSMSVRPGGSVRDVLALGRAPWGWRAYAAAVLAMAGLQAVLAIVQHGLLQHDMLTDLRPFVGLVRGPDWPVAAAVLGIGAPLSEELLFRGFLLGALAKSGLGFWGGAVLSTLVWTALHAGYSSVGLAEVFAIGLLLSWLLWRTGSLRVTIFCHALYNSLIVLALRLVELPA
jgi:membrane protease YdiL (CAAX protease family)